ncbi:hypothetical protein EsH8_VII_000906 [Colletotrichum jinshuiense]
MRLLDTTTLQPKEFFEDQIPLYAILSHTWGDDEVLFHDLPGGPTLTAGWAKVTPACGLARELGFSWIWIDTCCIDKSSSSELSEAINSMFRWYQKAALCIAYLADVASHPKPTSEDCAAALARSRWFSRGWTLQELLAPVYLTFYSAEWQKLGSRSVYSDAIAQATKIEAKYLYGSQRLANASVAERMSWAAKRQTTRVEDLAYCLLGIFDVNMPLIYGEGTKAFRRLQEAILRETDDQSIFAWGDLSEGNVLVATQGPRPLIAESPSLFENSGDIIPFSIPTLQTRVRIEHSGIAVITPLQMEGPSTWGPGYEPIFLAPLLCRRKGDLLNTIALCLRTSTLVDKGLDPTHAGTPYYRASSSLFTFSKSAWSAERLCSAFVYFDERRRWYDRKGQDQNRGCVIRTLPKGWRAGAMYSNYLGHADKVSLFPYTKRLTKSYGLGYPIVVSLESLSKGNLALQESVALILQYQYLSLFKDEFWYVKFSDFPGWMVNRAVAVPPGWSLQDVEAVVRTESERWPPDVVRRISNECSKSQDYGAAEASSSRSKDVFERSQLSPFTRFQVSTSRSKDVFEQSQLNTFTRFRVSVTREEVHGSLFLVSVEDMAGENESLEVDHLGRFKPVR